MENVEVWKDVIYYEGYYKVSSVGRVKSIARVGCLNDRILKQKLDFYGYFSISLSNNGNRVTKKIHKLVAIAFLGHAPCGFTQVINHINGNKSDNRVENLEITTQRDNSSKYRLTTKKSSKYTGVSWNKRRNKWRADIKIKGNQVYLGLFIDEELANIAYSNALINLDKYNNNKKQFRKLINK